MAQVHAADRAGAGDFKLVAALAAASGGESLVRPACGAGRHSDLRDVATALVPGLVSALVTAGILFQPIHRALHSGGIFHLHHHAAGTFVATGGKGCLATQTPAKCCDILASVQGLRPIGAAVLKKRISSRPRFIGSLKRARQRDGHRPWQK